MKRQIYIIIAAGALAAGAAIVYAQTATPNDKGSALTASLKSWVGQECTVYLEMEFDPRAGKSSLSSGSGDGVHEIEGIPDSITGVMSSVKSEAIVVTNGPRTTWIPRERIRIVTAYNP